MASCNVFDPQQKTRDSVLKELRNLFGNQLHFDIIRAVANQFKYDFDRSAHALLEMTNQIAVDDLLYSRTPPKGSFAGIAAKKDRSKTKTPASPNGRKPQVRLHQSASTTAISTIANKSKKAQELERVCKQILKGYKVIVILRGLPGSGKSTLARQILECTIGSGDDNRQHILSTDDFFNHPRQGYIFDPNRLQDAHEDNQRRTVQSMSREVSPVIIDNTNTQIWEMKVYAMMAVDFGYIVEILEPDTWWAFNEKELAKRNTHGVPKQKIKDMLDRYEKNITPQKLLSAYNLAYKIRKPPQVRAVPPVPEGAPSSDVVKSKSTSDLLNHKTSRFASREIEQSIEMINLMDFNEDCRGSNGQNTASWELVNPVDEILMCPTAVNKNEEILQPTEPVNNKSQFFEIANAWGVDEKALRSWDVVSPIQDSSNWHREFEGNVEVHANAQDPCDNQRQVEYRDNWSNVDSSDWKIITNPENSGEFKIMTPTGRDINSGPDTPVRNGVPKKMTLDKGCYTEENDMRDRDDTNNLKHLSDLFPKIPKKYLREIYNKCNKDFEWTVNLLLDDNSQLTTEHQSDDDDDCDLVENTISDSIVQQMENSEIMESHNFKRKSTNNVSHEALELKRCIESKFDINKEHYSDHVYRVKQSRFGTIPEAQPGTSSDVFEIITSESEDDFEEDDFDSNQKNIVEINLGEVLVGQLKSLFGVDESTLPEGFQPVVQMPRETATQIFTLYVESVLQQMEVQTSILEDLVREDEEFARKLQVQEEAQALTPERPPNLSEIMDEQRAISLHERQISEWRDMTADNLAAKLTRQKLFKLFPTVPEDSLVEILHAYGYDYNKTVEDLMASVGPEFMAAESDREPPINREVYDEMKEAELFCGDEEEQMGEIHSATFYRAEANKHLQNRQGLYDKAKIYYQRGMTEVAIFYSDLAKKETGKYDKANHLAAAAFVEEHSKRLQKFDTLDLHYLHVKEAISTLDIFIDRNINLLKGSSKKTQQLFIITGRGKNSIGGISKIKPAVQARLKTRKIRFVQLNPGLLKINVVQSSSMTSDLK